MRLAVLSLVAFAVLPSVSRGQAPVFEITPVDSSIKFDVKASVNIAGKFDKWDATLTFTSFEETTGVLEIIIQADSVDTGSGMKNSKLKSKMHDLIDRTENGIGVAALYGSMQTKDHEQISRASWKFFRKCLYLTREPYGQSKSRILNRRAAALKP